MWGRRVCTVCKHKFTPSKKYPRARRCASCAQAAARTSNRRAKYKLSAAEFRALWAMQRGRCAICLLPFPAETQTRTVIRVDHDHVTGKVRGLLCNACNVGVGMFKDDAIRMRRAADYLSRAGSERHLETVPREAAPRPVRQSLLGMLAGALRA